MGFCEGMLLAEKGGIPREVAMRAMLDSVIASPSLKYRAPFITEAPDEVWFNVNMMQKDMLLALEMGRQLDVPMPTTAISNEYLTSARGMGLAEHDFYIVFQALAKMAGVEAAVAALASDDVGIEPPEKVQAPLAQELATGRVLFWWRAVWRCVSVHSRGCKTCR